MRVPKIGDRVYVLDGAGKVFLGFGTYVANVDVYVTVTKSEDGEVVMLSERDAERPVGHHQRVPDNPKIQLDNGEVMYGCQVWWGPEELCPEEHRMDKPMM